MGYANKIASFVGKSVPTVVVPEAVDFDGTNDYLSRSSDLAGNADGKTFTLSAWIYVNLTGGGYRVYDSLTGGAGGLLVLINPNATITIVAQNAAASGVLQVDTALPLVEKTFYNILVSLDLTNSSNRHFYINDESVSVTWATYTNDNIDFTRTSHGIGASPTGSTKLPGRLAHVYLDYTYRDFSVEDNRRLFITADGKPASGQAALSPILYMPLNDPTTAHINAGTGGNFTLNGTIARSGRGPNQYNAAASTLDGSADYLSRGSLTGVADGKTLTASMLLKIAPTVSNKTIFYMSDGASVANNISLGSSRTYSITFENAAGNVILAFSYPGFSYDKYYHVAFSCDLTSTDNRAVMVDGVDVTSSVTWVTYTNDTIKLNLSSTAVGGDVSANFNGELSDFWFDTNYIDLSASNPFFDTTTGKPKYLGETGELPTGTQPLIYLPMRADDAGKNLGSGGDFTVNSGPYTGARGPSEFWANSAEFNGSTQYLSRASALTGAADGKVFSFAVAIAPDGVSGAQRVLSIYDSGALRFSLKITNDDIELTGRNTANSTILSATTTSPAVFSAGVWSIVLISIDLSSASNRAIYANGSAVTATWTTYTNDAIEFTASEVLLGVETGAASEFLDGKIGFLWFDTTYIDFSQEANRLKFFDAFNYPVDLGADGSLPTGTAPLIYMNKDFHLGTNLGTGGNFTPQNTPTDGGFVRG